MATVADERRPGWCWVDNDVIDKFGPALGPHALAVYLVLARYANRDTRKAWPSFTTIAKQIGVSRPTAIKAVSALIDAGLISTEKRTSGYGDWDSNAYTLLPVGAQSPLLGSKPPLLPSEEDLPRVVNGVDYGSKGGLLEQDLINKTQCEQENVAPDIVEIAPQAARAQESSKKARTTKAPPPAEIALVRSITSRYPDKTLWEPIVAAVSGKSADDIRAAYTAWVSRGFKPTNYAWLLEWVPNGIPAAPGRSTVRNGHAIPNGLPQPEMVWGVVQQEIDRVHYFGTPNLPQPIMSAVEAVGGWYAVCKCDPGGSIPARLRDAYRSAIGA